MAISCPREFLVLNDGTELPELTIFFRRSSTGTNSTKKNCRLIVYVVWGSRIHLDEALMEEIRAAALDESEFKKRQKV